VLARYIYDSDEEEEDSGSSSSSKCTADAAKPTSGSPSNSTKHNPFQDTSAVLSQHFSAKEQDREQEQKQEKEGEVDGEGSKTPEKRVHWDEPPRKQEGREEEDAASASASASASAVASSGTAVTVASPIPPTHTPSLPPQPPDSASAPAATTTSTTTMTMTSSLQQDIYDATPHEVEPAQERALEVVAEVRAEEVKAATTNTAKVAEIYDEEQKSADSEILDEPTKVEETVAAAVAVTDILDEPAKVEETVPAAAAAAAAVTDI
jgi:hypothetical protein